MISLLSSKLLARALGFPATSSKLGCVFNPITSVIHSKFTPKSFQIDTRVVFIRSCHPHIHRHIATTTTITMSTDVAQQSPHANAEEAPEVHFFEKPLNVLVHLDEQLLVEQQLKSPRKQKANESRTYWIQNSNELFKGIRKSVLYLLQQRFTVYPITTDELRLKPWASTTKLLVLITRDPITENEFLSLPLNQSIKDFHQSGGAICLLHVKQICTNEQLCFDQQQTFQPEKFAQLLRKRLGEEFFHLEESNTDVADFADLTVPSVTSHYLFADQSDQLISRRDLIQSSLQNSLYTLIDFDGDDIALKERIQKVVETNNTPIVLWNGGGGGDGGDGKQQLSFDLKQYFDTLTTVKLGRQVIFADVTKSTHPLCEQLSCLDGLVVVANQQVEGRGRGENHWISPQGSISFSYSFSISTGSKLFSYLGYVQHLASLAIVQAIKAQPGLEELDVKIKWPNDIYWSNQHKLVGILTTSKIEGNRVQFYIGCGLNLSNQFPSRSLNNLIQQHLPNNAATTSLTSEQIVAASLSQMEQLLNWFEHVDIDAVKERYYHHWCLSGRAIRLKDGTKAQILGVDDQGYLQVCMEPGRQVQSLQPDGNRFDMIRNLSPSH